MLDEEAYQQALAAKLVEEAQEFLEEVNLNTSDNKEGLMQELADLHEVIDTLMVAYSLDQEKVQDMQCRRRSERGSCESRLKLIWVE